MKKLALILLFCYFTNCFSQQYSQKWSDINYAGDGMTYHLLDIYLPTVSKPSYPAVVLIYGSAWFSNNLKGSDMSTIGSALLDAGYAVVTPNHRSSSDAIYPAQIHDIKATIRFIRGNATTYKLDPTFIGITGSSSGGHLAALAGTSGGIRQYTVGSTTMDLEGSVGNFTSYSSEVNAICDWFGPTDFLVMDACGSSLNHDAADSPESSLIGGPIQYNPEKCALANPITYVDPNDPPFLIIHGDADQLVPYCNSEALFNALQTSGVESEYILVPGGQHYTGVHTEENFAKMVDHFNTALGSCTPTNITPYVQVNDGSLQNTSNVTVESGTKVVLSPQPLSDGSWSWTGCGTSGISREQTIYPTSSCTAVATYTNSCGAQSSLNFNINVNDGTNNIIVRARGIDGSEQIQLQVNGNTVNTWTLSNNYQDYTASGSGTVRVNFINDDGSVRDVQVDYVQIDGTTYQAEDQLTNTGVWQDGSCGGSNSEWLHCNGYIEFVPGGASDYTITVRAMGTNGSEQISLAVGGTAVQTWTLGTSMGDYTATTSLSGNITVEFINDDGTNRDVQVDYIQINGATTLQAEDQATNTGVWQNSACGGQYSEWLHCNGYIEFSAFKSAGAMGIGEFPENNNISLYPNPAGDILNISVAGLGEGAAVLSIYNINGKAVKTAIVEKGENSININGLETGLYVVVINYDNELVTRKFMKK